MPGMTSRRLWILCFLALSGCATGSAVRASKDLPVRNVVLYRSGVGYFEREGSFDGDALEFAVKQHEVGDFLSSLTAIDRTSGGVRSVSFDVPEQVAEEPEESDEEKPKKREHKDPRVDVKLDLGKDGEHDLLVAYVVGSPIWRPSYRVVFDKDQTPLLQAWAVVQNTSGEDWNDIRLSLTTGAPISFRSDLGTPIVPERPLVSDEGETVAAVPVGEVAVAQEAEAPAPPPAPAASMAEPEMAEDMDGMASAEMRREKKADARPRAKASAPARMPRAGLGAAVMELEVQPSATASVLSESVTRYDIGERVTIPDGGSTMVAIVSQRVNGERAHLFAPDGGVPNSYHHPFSVARLNNQTGAVLEKGPVSVLADGAFLGQGMLDTLPREASAFVPFSVDKSIVVEPAESYSEEQGALVRVQRGMVTVQRFSQRKTRYHVRNGGSEQSKVYVRHQRWGNAELLAPPAGTELSPGRALVPVVAKAKQEVELDVVERTPVQMDFVFMDQPAADAIAIYLQGPAVDAAQGAALKNALDLRSQLVKVMENITGKEREQNELENGSSETRKNLKAIEKVASAADLRGRLVTRLKELDGKLAEVTKQLVELRTRRSELEARLNEALDSVSLEVKEG
jgi:hypothetical protein